MADRHFDGALVSFETEANLDGGEGPDSAIEFGEYAVEGPKPQVSGFCEPSCSALLQEGTGFGWAVVDADRHFDVR